MRERPRSSINPNEPCDVKNKSNSSNIAKRTVLPHLRGVIIALICNQQRIGDAVIGLTRSPHDSIINLVHSIPSQKQRQPHMESEPAHVIHITYIHDSLREAVAWRKF